MEAFHGLEDNHLAIMKQVLSEYADKIDHVAVFGSRATGSFKKYSDIDLVVYGDISETDIDKIKLLFLESYLAYKVDVVAYNNVTHQSFKDHIDSVAKKLFSKEELTLQKEKMSH